jgi:flagellar basal-body rod protein FlgB
VSDPVADLTTRVVETALDCTAVQHRIAANNLANLETPGYTARAVSFQDRLRAALSAEQRGDEAHGLGEVSPSVAPTVDPPGPDGNNVSIEREMMTVGEAALRYDVLTRIIDRKLQMVATVIGDGRSG